MKTNLSLSKKIFLSLVIAVSFFLVLELTIRVYHAIKFREGYYLIYGEKMVRELIKKAKSKRLARIYAPSMVSDEAEALFLKRREISLGEDFSVYSRDYIRNWNSTIEKVPGTIRIITVGGSFVWGTGISATESWPYLLGEKLNKHSTDQKYEAINCSSVGSGINYILVKFIRYIAPLKPDYVILFSACNDYGLVNPDYKISFAWKASHFLYNISRLYSTLRDKLAIMISKDIYFFQDIYDVTLTEDNVNTAINLYRKRLEQMLTVCRENNITLIVGLQPAFLPENLKNLGNLLDEKRLIELSEKIKKKGRISYYEFRYYMQGRFNLEMKRFAESEGVLLFDGLSVFPKDRHLYFMDPIHFNPEGAAVFAQELFLFLIKKGI